MEELIYEVRAVKDVTVDEDKRIISGTAVVFECESEDLGGFTEVMKRGSITQEFIDTQDVQMLYNHSNDNGILARRNKGKGSLYINVDEVGVHFSFRAKKTNLGEEILQGIKDGDLSGCSFSYGIRKNNTSAVKLVRRSNNVPLQEVYSVDAIRDLAIVATPAYPQTSVNARALDELKQTEEQQKQKELDEVNQKELDEIKRMKDFEKYYNTILSKYLSK